MAFRRRFTRRRFARSSNALRRVWIPAIVDEPNNQVATTVSIATPSLFTSEGTNQKYAATLLRIRGTITALNGHATLANDVGIGIRKIDFDELDDGADPSSAIYAQEEDLLYWTVFRLLPQNVSVTGANHMYRVWEVDIKAKRRMALEEVIVMDIATPINDSTQVLGQFNLLFHAP